MNTFINFLYRVAGSVPEYVADCPPSERQRYRNIAYGMGIVWIVTAFSAHHAAVLWGIKDPLAWLPGLLWACFMVACDRMVVMALTKREDRPMPLLPVVVRLVLVLVNASVLGFFAILAYNQDGLARVRFEQQQRAIAGDRQFFVGYYRLQERQNKLADSVSALAAVKTKIAEVPSHIADLRAMQSACQTEFEAIQKVSMPKRSNLRSDLVGLMSRIGLLRRGSLSESTTVDALPALETEADRLRQRLSALDSEESFKRRSCTEIAAREAAESRRYYDPLREEKTRLQKDVEDTRGTLKIASQKVDASVAESERVSEGAFGFNLSGQGNALVEVLKENWLARMIALTVWSISLCLETLPILLKSNARGGPYDQRVSREERAYESTLQTHLVLETIQRDAAVEKVRAVMPEVMEISKPLTLFARTEEEIAKVRRVRESAAKADLSRLQEVDDTFNAAVTQSRKLLRQSWITEAPTQGV
jgi:hypothetical protein